jgi:hypothetical protein
MGKREDGGPAFAHGNPEQGGDPGMSMRDYFAAAALTGLINRGFAEFGNAESAYAALAYEYADAMIAARTHHPKEGE